MTDSENLTWSQKDPNDRDRFGIDWRPEIGDDPIVESTWSFVEQAGLTASDETFDAHFTWLWLSGGTEGAIAVIENHIVTLSGRHLDSTKRLPIISTSAEERSGYTVPTPAQMMVRMPNFAGVDASVLREALDEGAAKVAADWKEADFRIGIMLYAAHVLTLDGHGKGTEADLAREGLGDFQRIKSGGLDVARFDRPRIGPPPSGLDTTSYGKRFKHLLRMNKGGPRRLMTEVRPCHPTATDC